MSTRRGRRDGRGRAQTAAGPGHSRRAAGETDLEDLLREAEEALRDCELPSGDWKAGGRLPRPRPGTSGQRPSPSALPFVAPRPGAGFSGLEDIDSEVAFWLLFPPRGNA